jgi:hypothetical protein
LVQCSKIPEFFKMKLFLQDQSWSRPRRPFFHLQPSAGRQL